MEMDMATKTKKAKTAKTTTKRTPTFKPDGKITVLAKDNPRRGKRTGKVFGYYKTGMTVEQFLAKPDALMVDLVADVERGHIKVA
jgi:hypothetical protein